MDIDLSFSGLLDQTPLGSNHRVQSQNPLSPPQSDIATSKAISKIHATALCNPNKFWHNSISKGSTLSAPPFVLFKAIKQMRIRFFPWRISYNFVGTSTAN
jgi:hypothetical protein